MSHICANDECRSQVGATNRPENIDDTSLSRLFACKVVDVFSFHLQIFHWFIATSSRRHFQGHQKQQTDTINRKLFENANSPVFAFFSKIIRFYFIGMFPDFLDRLYVQTDEREMRLP
jgi:hypothetical protein